jgi:hypothetical protein
MMQARQFSGGGGGSGPCTQAGAASNVGKQTPD